VYFPGAGAIYMNSFEQYGHGLYDFIVKAGRAVLFPTYKSTFERDDELESGYPNESTFYREHVVQWAKDLGRSIDYLESRPDIDKERLAYFGYSWGGSLGPIMLALEPRLKVGVLYVAGFLVQKRHPEADPINFVSRVTSPVLMLNGKYDFLFPEETSQIPLYRLLGTAPEHKRHFVYESGHSLPRTVLIRETLDWLDRYLGPVQ
jgi:dienelactone hydrolase